MADAKKDEPIIELTEVVEEAPGPAEGRWMETAPPPSQPPNPSAEPSRFGSEQPPITPEPPRPSLPNIEAEMRAIREALLARVEKWTALEGVGVLERVAREIFPRIAEEILKKEIKKLKAEAEEKE